MKNRLTIIKDNMSLLSAWQGRLDVLASRKQNPLSEMAFCKKYKFDRHVFNKNKKSILTGKNFPRDKKIKAVEAAFKKEGV